MRRRRTELGMTAAELARRAGVSAPFVSLLETGQSSISIPRLYRVAEALATTPNSLLPLRSEAQVVTRSGDGPGLRAADTHGSQVARLLTSGGPDAALKAHHYRIAPGDAQQEWFQHRGEDFIYVVGGSLIVEFADGQSTSLEAGDAMHHRGETAHRWIQTGASPAEVVIVNNIPL